jgi:ureidoacrylate peracid hydrolase
MSTREDAEIVNRLAHRQPLRTLEEKVDPKHCALVVIDMQNDFCAEGGMMSKEGLDISAVQAMAGRLPPLIDQARDAGALIVFVKNVYTTDTNLYLSDSWLEQATRKRQGSYTKRPVCAAGSWEGEFYGNISPHANDAIITKHRYSAFYNTDLDTVLRAHAIRTLVLTGVATNVCVETTAREGFVRDYYIVLVEDGTACYSAADQQATLSNIDRYFGQISSTEELMKLWK